MTDKVKLSKKEKKNILNRQIYEQRANAEIAPKYKQAFDNGTMNIETLYKQPKNRQREYLRREVAKKYKFDINKLSPTFCETCAQVALYKDDGYITDEEIIGLTGLRHL
jgi:hypothetical protein